jgi:3-hydroxyisobutyrate dehydrogenase-like beta-hydroxyacid dehydrogenase
VEEKPLIGFIGPGVMGGAMISTLLRSWYPVLTYDINAKNLASSLAEGAEAEGSFAEVVERCDYVLTSLRSSEIFVEVTEEHLLPSARKGQVFVDLGTTVAEEERRLNRAYREKGAVLVDAPVSGGRMGCATGTLHIFVGGDKEVVKRCWPILETLGRSGRVVYCGPSGSGQIVKAVNQLAMGLADAAYMEAIAFGVRAGVSPIAIMHAVGGDEGWRRHFAGLAAKVVMGQGEDVLIKYPEFGYFLDEARRNDFPAPILTALYEWVKKGPHDYVDNMNRPRPSVWRELMNRKRDEDTQTR